MIIERIQGDFTVCKVADVTSINLSSPYCFIGKTDEEISLVCRAEDVPADWTVREDGWRMMRIRGVLEFQEIGILARIAALLAESNISILAVSTFNTDYILVKAENEMNALRKLAAGGYEIPAEDLL